MNIINLTPHNIVIALDNEHITLPPTAPPARCAIRSERIGEINGIPVVSSVFGDVENLPSPQPDTVYVVSTVIAQRVARADVLSPDTGPTAIRENGQVIAVRALQSFV